LLSLCLCQIPIPPAIEAEHVTLFELPPFPVAQGEKLTSLRYMHIQKCGTSFVLVLREYLDACVQKNFTCNGVAGGGFFAWQNEDHAEHAFFDTNVSPEEETCHDHLVSCHDIHVLYSDAAYAGSNPVTMLREPMERFISHLEWYGRVDSPVLQFFQQQLENIDLVRNFVAKPSNQVDNTQTAFLLGYYRTPEQKKITDARDAFVTLRNKFVFFGLTNFWGLSVCLFHCELGGTANPAVECQNTREGYRHQKPDFQPRTAELAEFVQDDVRLYDYAQRYFFARVHRCNCTDVCYPVVRRHGDPFHSRQ